MTKFLANIKDGKLSLGTSFNEARFAEWAKQNEGVILEIQPRNEMIGSHLRRFFEGAVVPYFALQHPVYDQKTLRWRMMTTFEARHEIKKEFNPKWVTNRKGQREQIAGETKHMSKNAFKAFIERVTDYMVQNGFSIPDSEMYKEWVDSIPEVDEIYPPVKELQERAEKQLSELNS